MTRRQVPAPRIPLSPYRGPGGPARGTDTHLDADDLVAVYDRIAGIDPADPGPLPPALEVLAARIGGPAGLHGDYDPGALAALPRGSAGLSLGFASALEAADPRPGMRLLDVGCGAGPDLALAALAVGPGGAVAGLDSSPAMIERARLGTARVAPAPDLRIGDAGALPWPGGSFDRIVMNCALSLFPDRDAALEEAGRIAAAEARLAIADLAVGEGMPGEVRRALEGWGSGVAGRLDSGEVQRALGRAGWEVTRVVTDTLTPAALWSQAGEVGADPSDPRQRRVLKPLIRVLSRDLRQLTLLARRR